MPTYGFLPKLSTPEDAASFKHSVMPFYHIAKEHISEYLHNPLELYTTLNPFVLGSTLSVVSSLTVFVVSLSTGNWSWVDRLWAILPVLYSFHYLGFAALHGLISPRLLLISTLQLLWGARLTFNYWRKGGFKRHHHIHLCPDFGRGSEDYRWVYVRKLVMTYLPSVLEPLVLVIFNFVFISFIQNILLFLMTAPNYLVMLADDETPLNYLDIVCLGCLIASMAIETLADEQQWVYQNAKHSTPSKSTRSHSNAASSVSYCQPQDLQRGFITGGLFRYSRHPNFTCEQLNWYIFYVSGCIATRTWWNWTVIAPLALTLVIFVGSTFLTEWITAQKYPEYKVYQNKVGKFLPLPGYVWDGGKTRKHE